MGRICIKTDTIYQLNIKTDITIVHISDIHFSMDTSSQRMDKIKNKILSINPNYIMITGDMIDYPSVIDSSNKIKELVVFLTSLAKTSKVIISLGNHDIIRQKDLNFFNKINDLYNIYVLNNNTYEDEFIYVFGLTLPTDYYYNLAREESVEILLENLDNCKDKIINLPKKLLKIAMIHSPVKVVDKRVLPKLKEFDLILSGHTHNGMVPNYMSFLFKENTGLFGPNKKIFPKIAKGKIEKDIDNKKITIIINGAITKLSIRTAKLISKLNFLYDVSINKIIVKKEKRNKI